MQSGVNEKRWCVHKKREHSKNKRGANLGVVEVKSRALEKTWLAHKEKERKR